MDNKDLLEDPLALFVAQEKAGADAVARFNRVTRELFTTRKGKEWLALAMARYNFMGTVFSMEDGMNSLMAAHSDGNREVISDILNSAYAGKTTNDDSDDE